MEASSVVAAGSSKAADSPEHAFWSCPREQLFDELKSSPSGLDSGTAAQRLRKVGPNSIREQGGPGAVAILAKQFASPLVLILIFGAVISRGSP